MKFAIFAEGLTEVIFTKYLLQEYFGHDKLQIVLEEKNGKAIFIHFRKSDQTAQSELHQCFIYNIGNDESVISKIKENYSRMMDAGFEAFFGLRDVKSESYLNFGEHIFSALQFVIDSFKTTENIYFHWAKMETEAWFLAEPSLFYKIDNRLTIETIELEIGINLDNIDPEIEFDNPSRVVERIHEIVNLFYRKREDEIYRIVSRIDWEELCLAVRDKGKISYFLNFLDDLDEVLSQT